MASCTFNFQAGNFTCIPRMKSFEDISFKSLLLQVKDPKNALRRLLKKVDRFNAWFNFTCYHPPPGQPRGQVQPFSPGGGELFEAVLSRGEGGGANRNNFLLFL